MRPPRRGATRSSDAREAKDLGDEKRLRRRRAGGPAQLAAHLDGSLDAPDQLAPTYESWVIRRETWLPEFPLVHSYPRDRESAGRSDA